MTGVHLVLRDLAEEDLGAIIALRSDPEVARNMDWEPETAEVTRAWLTETIRHNRLRPRFGYNLAIVSRETGAVIGWVGIGTPSSPSCAGELDFGYALLRAYWGRGHMTEALRLLLDFAFGSLKAVRVFGECHSGNRASARVMEKAGMTFESVCVLHGIGCTQVQRRYVIRQQEWRAGKEAER